MLTKLRRSNDFAQLRYRKFDWAFEIGQQGRSVGLRYSKVKAGSARGDGNVEFVAQKGGFLVAVADFIVTESVTLEYGGEEFVRFRYFAEGGASTEFEGRQLPAGAAQIVVQPRGVQLRDEFVAGAQTRFMSVFLSAAAMVAMTKGDLDKLPRPLADFATGASAPFAILDAVLDRTMLNILERVFSSRVSGPWRPLYLQGAALELIALHLSQLCERNAPKEAFVAARDKKCIVAAREILEQDMLTTMTVSQLARLVGINRSKLSSGFRDIYGIGLGEFAFSLRMQRAQQFLRTGEGSVAELARLLGYAHPGNLTTAIKRHYGATPSQLRERSRRH